MTDREMLEFAAKAAGYEIEWFGESDTAVAVRAGNNWNPRDNDADSRQLQVKLQIDLEFEPNGIHDHVSALGFVPNTSYPKYTAILLGDNPCEAARLAVLHVAAEIGKAMP